MNYLIQVSVCLIALYLFYFTLLRGDKFFNMQRAFLLGALGISLFIPLVNFSPEIAQRIVPIGELSIQIATIPTDLSMADNSWKLIDYLQVVYLLGALLMTIRFVKDITRIYRIIRKGTKETVDGYTLVRTDEKIPLASFYKYIFVQNTLPVEDEDLSYLLLHEKKHIQDYHSIDLIIISVVKIFLWFNPVLWLFEKDLKLVHEFTCDHEVIKHTSRTHYEKLLIKSLFERVGLPFASSFNEISIKNRIIMMNKQNSIWIKKLKILISLPVVFLLVLACNPDGLPSATPLEISGKVIDDEGKGLPGVNVVIDGTKTGTITNLAGEYRIGNLGETAKSMTFSFVGFEAETINIGSKSVIDVVLKQGALPTTAKESNAIKVEIQYTIDMNDGETFSGKLTDPSGSPLSGYAVVALGEGNQAQKVFTDEKGDFKLPTTKVIDRFVVFDAESSNVKVLEIK